MRSSRRVKTEASDWVSPERLFKVNCECDQNSEAESQSRSSWFKLLLNHDEMWSPRGWAMWLDKGIDKQIMYGTVPSPWGPWCSVAVLFYRTMNGYFKGCLGLKTWKVLTFQIVFPISYTNQFLCVVENYYFGSLHPSLLSSCQLLPPFPTTCGLDRSGHLFTWSHRE